MCSDLLVDALHALHAVRLVRRQPLFSAAAILRLAVGIGAASAVFAPVNAVLLANLPFRRAPAFVAARRRGDPLFATNPSDPAVYGFVTATILGVTAVAAYLPARHAADADPAALLRT